MGKFNVGAKVTANGYPGVIVRELPYAQNMYEVKLASGIAAVCGSDIYPRPTYERVTFKLDEHDAKKTKTVLLRIVSESARMLSGYEVDKEGEEIQPRGFERRLRVISLDLITKRVSLVMNNKYGMLEKER